VIAMSSIVSLHSAYIAEGSAQMGSIVSMYSLVLQYYEMILGKERNANRTLISCSAFKNISCKLLVKDGNVSMDVD
jgi:hypothetical protein